MFGGMMATKRDPDAFRRDAWKMVKNCAAREHFWELLAAVDMLKEAAGNGAPAQKKVD